MSKTTRGVAVRGDKSFWIEWHPKIRVIAGIGGRRHRETRLSAERIAAKAKVKKWFASDMAKEMLNHLPNGPAIGAVEIDPYVGATVRREAWGDFPAVEHTLAAHAGGPWWTLGNGRTINLLESLRSRRLRVVSGMRLQALDIIGLNVPIQDTTRLRIVGVKR